MRRVIASGLAAALLVVPTAPSTALAADRCVRFVNSQFDAPGIEADNLNGEWVRIRNVCATRRNIGGWRIHDYQRNHTYRFPATFRIPGGNAVTLYTGKGNNTGAKRYWGLDGPVWNNEPPEWAYLRRTDGTIASRWTEY